MLMSDGNHLFFPPAHWGQILIRNLPARATDAEVGSDSNLNRHSRAKPLAAVNGETSIPSADV